MLHIFIEKTLGGKWETTLVRFFTGSSKILSGNVRILTGLLMIYQDPVRNKDTCEKNCESQGLSPCIRQRHGQALLKIVSTTL